MNDKLRRRGLDERRQKKTPTERAQGLNEPKHGAQIWGGAGAQDTQGCRTRRGFDKGERQCKIWIGGTGAAPWTAA
jgi:hypothetical protein